MKTSVFLFDKKDEVLRQELKEILTPYGVKITSETASLRLFHVPTPDFVIICSSQTSYITSLNAIKQIRKTDRHIPILLIVKNSSESYAIAALRAGVTDYIKRSMIRDELQESIERNLGCGRNKTDKKPRKQILLKEDQYTMVGHSLVMQEVKNHLSKVSQSESAVLITGETGTGKELAANLIHQNSPRRNKPLVSINCAALPDNLVESELFGYERGAFTGALSTKKGMFELAKGGTLFLDEIGDMSPLAQAKILRIIESKESYRLGGSKANALDFRLIAATNKNQDELSQGQRFRNDLYYRLNVAKVHIPPLRDRREDILELSRYFIQRFNLKFKRNIRGFRPEAFEEILYYDWPGNVRELKNVVENSFINLPEKNIRQMGLPHRLQNEGEIASQPQASTRDRVIAALSAANWNKSKAAKDLNWSRMTLYRKMEKYNIIREKQDYSA